MELKYAKFSKMSQNGPTYNKWNLTKNGSLLAKITHIFGKETKFQNRIDTPGLILSFSITTINWPLFIHNSP